jgi:hypothetical protein
MDKAKQSQFKSELNESVIKFIDAMIMDNYNTAHVYLGEAVESVIKEGIKKASKKNPFSKNAEVKGTKEKAKKSAFGKEFPKAKDPNKKNKGKK